jgi:O-antigen/teichoic acid export membrane protein
VRQDRDNHPEVDSDSFRERLTTNSVLAITSKVANLLIAFLLVPFIVGHLGDADYGLWILLGAIVAYGALADFGIASALTKYVSEYGSLGRHDSCRRIIASALCLYSLIGLGLILLFIAVAPAVPALFDVAESQRDAARKLAVLMGIGLGLSIPCAASTAVLQGLHRFDITAVLSTARSLLFAIGVAVSLSNGGDVLSVAAMHIVAMVAVQIPAIWWIYRLTPEYRFGFLSADFDDMRKLVSFSWPLFLVNFGGLLQSRSDEIVIGSRLPVGMVTPYSFAMLLARVPQIIAEQFISFILPIASELNAKDQQEKVRELFIMSTRLTLAIFISPALVIAVLANSILSVWVGESYSQYAALVWILSAALAVDILQWPAAMILQGMNRHHIFGFIAVGTGIANVLLSLALIPSLGLTGVAVATLITAFVESAFFVIPYAMRTLTIQTPVLLKSVLFPILVPTALTGILLTAFNNEFVVSSFTGIVGVGLLALLAFTGSYLAMPGTGVERKFIFGAVRGLRRRLRSPGKG